MPLYIDNGTENIEIENVFTMSIIEWKTVLKSHLKLISMLYFTVERLYKYFLIWELKFATNWNRKTKRKSCYTLHIEMETEYIQLHI